MKFETISQIKNPSLQREEFVLKVESEKTPSNKEIIALLGKNETLSVVKQIKGSFGKEDFDVEVVVYDNQKAKDEIEVVGRKIRKKLEAEAKKAADAAKAAAGAQ
jgi:ribosomal protein S24E